VDPALAQTFVFGAEGEPVSFDPAVITDGVSQRVTTQVYDNLVRYKGASDDGRRAGAGREVGRLGGRQGLDPPHPEEREVPRRRAPRCQGGGLELERWWKASHPQHENQLKAGQTFEYWEGQFDGFDEKSIVSKVEAVDSHTVRVTLKQPQAPFLSNLAIFSFGIASPKAVEKWGTAARVLQEGEGLRDEPDRVRALQRRLGAVVPILGQGR
jgi:peptide/nickel transport system substrate-binding protein